MEDFILPKKWCLKINKENKIIINNWRKNIIKYSSEDCYYEYIVWDGAGDGRNNFFEITFEQFKKYVLKQNIKETMEIEMNDILNITYDNPILRQTTIPLFMSNPGMGKTSIIKEFAKSRGVRMVKITLSQRMPNEVVGMVMPDTKTGKLIVYDSHELDSLKDGDVLFFDEVFNGVLKQTLDATLNLLEDRRLPSGKKLANVLIVAASNPQGLINLTPQIKERFIKYDLTFNKEQYQKYLKNKYGIPEEISKHFCTLINKEKFEDTWDFVTPRSIEKAINQIGCDLISPYNDLLLPILNTEIVASCDLSFENIKKGDKFNFLPLLRQIIQQQNTSEKLKITKTDIIKDKGILV